MIDPGVLNPPDTSIAPNEVLIIRYKYPPYAWALLVSIEDSTVEGEIRPSTRRRLEKLYTVEVDDRQGPETFEVLKLTLKKAQI